MKSRGAGAPNKIDIQSYVVTNKLRASTEAASEKADQQELQGTASFVGEGSGVRAYSPASGSVNILYVMGFAAMAMEKRELKAV
jgi:hypothetical protein